MIVRTLTATSAFSLLLRALASAQHASEQNYKQVASRAVLQNDGTAVLAPFIGADKQTCGWPVVTELLGAVPTLARTILGWLRQPATTRLA